MSSININPGLEGIYVCETELSEIKGQEGKLTLRGFPLAEVALNATYEELLYHLWYGNLPSQSELAEFSTKLALKRDLDQITVDLLRRYADRDPMEVLRMAVSSIPSENFEDDCLAVVAKIPTILAYLHRIRSQQDIIKPDTELDHVTNFITMLGMDEIQRRSKALTVYLNTVIEHGVNASTFTTRTIFSTDSDVVSAVVGGIGALKGPKHGGAPGPVLDMIKNIGSIENVETWIRNELDQGHRLMGFGHRVYKTRDPRAEVLSHAASEFYQDQQGSLYDLAQVVEQKAVQLLEEYKPGRNLQTNVEFYTAMLLNGIGLDTDYFSSIFAMGRVGGWTAHLREQLQNNRLIRPRAVYVGDHNRSWIPLHDR